MAVISVTLSTEAASELVDALCHEFNYTATLLDGTPNPETRAQFARRMHLRWLKDRVKVYRAYLAELTVNQTEAEIT